MALKHKKKITIEDLAGMTQRGFIEVGKQFEQVDAQFVEVRQEVAEVKREVAEVKQEVAEVKREVREMKENFSELFTKLDKFISLYEKQEQELLSLATQMHRLEERVARLEIKRSAAR